MTVCLSECQHQAPAPSRRQGGFSLFEFAVAAAVFATLVGIAANRLNLYQDQLETVAAEQLIVNLQVALQMRISHLTIVERKHELRTVMDENPMGWLSEKPKNYLGEYYSPDNEKMATGHWYFDRNEKTLIYLLNNHNSFATGSPNLLKFKVKSLRLASNPAQAEQSAVIESISLVQVFDQPTVSGQ